MTPRPPVVIARRDALRERLDGLGLSVRDVEAATDGEVSRSTVANVLTKPDYGITRPKAEAIARVINTPVGALLVHRDGAPLA